MPVNMLQDTCKDKGLHFLCWKLASSCTGFLLDSERGLSSKGQIKSNERTKISSSGSSKGRKAFRKQHYAASLTVPYPKVTPDTRICML